MQLYFFLCDMFYLPSLVKSILKGEIVKNPKMVSKRISKTRYVNLLYASF